MAVFRRAWWIAVITTIWPINGFAQQVPVQQPVLTYANVLATIGTAFAVIAFFRPNIAALLRRLVNRVAFFPLANIELGFGQLGPTIGIAGTLLGVPNDQFVKLMTVQVIRKADNLTHTFQWAAFKPVGILPPDLKDIRAALGFTLRAGEGLPVNIVFSDSITRAKVQDNLTQFRTAWHDYLRKKSLVPSSMTVAELNAHHATFTNGSEGPLASQIYAEIQSLFYWSEGEYTARIITETWRPSKKFETIFEFSLVKQESKNLSTGIVEAMMVAADQPNVTTTFVNPALRAKT